jgi:hypothetical protein
MQSHRRFGEPERGVALVLFALSLVALLTVSGLVIDGGRAYAERRQMQNASDSAAMAGARELDKVRTSMQDTTAPDLPPDAIYDAALAKALENGADEADFECYIVDEEGDYVTGSATTSLCPDEPTDNLPGGLDAAGVEVVSRATKDTFLVRVAGIDDFQARADATAQVQGLRGLQSYATPFMICAFDRPPGEGEELLIPSGGNYILKPAAIWSQSGTNDTGETELNGMGGPWYKMHGPHVPNCELDSETWKGLVDSGTYTLPGVWTGNNGTKAGPTRSVLNNGEGCAGDDDDDYTNGCVLIAPVCLRLSDIDGTEFEDDITDDREDLYCVTFGAFKVVETHPNEHYAALLGDETVVTEGIGGGAPELNEPRLIKLTE